MHPSPAETASVAFVARLAAFGDRPALVTPDAVVSYTSLAARVEAFAARLGDAGRLVLVAGANEVEPIVAYLAALSSGHPVILVPGDSETNLAAVEEAYDPDVVVRDGQMNERRELTAHHLHPGLALLLSTSGSTGSPKLVRLSAQNVQSNAESIASYLSIRPSDVAATTLPMHYCYGLSVINSHLLAGASLMLTSLSVVDPCFWEQFRAAGGTTLAGVPYTFDLLDRVGFADMDLPSLRYLTQAGGQMAPAQIERYAALGRRKDFELFVMYGQTEATARMGYLPPDLASSCPTAIGLPIPGGSFSLAPLPEMPLERSRPEAPTDVGELVYTGDNVMLGYADSPTDLALGRVVTSLRTGDVARRRPDGLFEIIGRRNRFAKIFGMRIDLDQVERVFGVAGVTAYCAGGDSELIVAVESDHHASDIETVAKRQLGLPAGAVRVCFLAEVPRLATGKPDYRSITALADAMRPPAGPTPASSLTGVGDTDRVSLRQLYAELLDRPDATCADSFVTLDGDSLSYVEMSIRLEEVLGHLPADWHVTPIGSLASSTRRRPRGFRSLETNVLLRAVAIIVIVATHGNLFTITGGAHLLLAVAGFNFGRFHLSSAPRRERVRHAATSVLRIAVPSMAWIGLVALLGSTYTLTNALLLNGVIGPPGWTEPAWHYWFIEAIVYTMLAMTALIAVPWVDRLERRWSFWLPLAMAGLGLLTRYELISLRDGDVIHRAHIIFWLFALGWAAAKATSTWQRVALSVLTIATVPGFFDDSPRELFVIVALLLLVWVRSIRVPSYVAGPAGVLASASLYIYLSHWQIYPHLEDRYPVLAVAASLAGGVILWQVVTRARGWFPASLGRTRHLTSDRAR